MSAANPTPIDTDALSSLEERILRAVELVAQLRREKEAAEARVRELSATQTASKELEAEIAHLRDEVEALRGERQQVRSRIEKLLGQMDALAG